MGTFQLRKAERKKVKLKLGVSGPSGSGKTYSSLLLAYGMTGSWEKITLIDTENGSGELYSSLGPYNVISFEAPYSPQRYVEAIDAALVGGAEVIVIDSISHEWDGKGGCLDIQTQLGGRYQDWARVTPMHNAFVDKILHSPCHVIVTTRKKQDYEMTKDSSGKAKVQKMGMKEIQRDGFEYELTINFDVEINHFATASKDRTGIFMPKGPFQITPDTGKELLAWSESGASAKPVESPKQVISMNTTELKPEIDSLEEAKQRTRKLLVLKKDSKELLFAIEKKLGKKIAEFNEQDFNEFTKELENGN
jgi:hypothetical protein